MPVPEFVAMLRGHIGHDLLWLSSATAVVLDDRGRVLLGLRSDTGTWALPGGIVDPAEQPADAAIREIFEETGVVAVPERLLAVTVSRPFSYPNGDQVQYLDLAFRCRAIGGEACVNDSESTEVGWHALDSLPKYRSERTTSWLRPMPTTLRQPSPSQACRRSCLKPAARPGHILARCDARLSPLRRDQPGSRRGRPRPGASQATRL